MRHSLWLYPGVEIVHIAGIVLLVGCVASFDLRMLGWSRQIPVSVLARHLLPWSIVGFLVVLPSGLLMFPAHAADLYFNRVSTEAHRHSPGADERRATPLMLLNRQSIIEVVSQKIPVISDSREFA